MKKRVLDKDLYVFLDRPPVSLYREEEKEEKLVEIDRYLKTLSSYTISLSSLSAVLSTRAERTLHLNLAMILLSEEKLLAKTKELKRIPLKVFSNLVEEPIHELKKAEKVILAYALLLEVDAFPMLRKILCFSTGKEEKTTPIDGRELMGLALKRSAGFAYILTSDGQFAKIRDKETPRGEVAFGSKVWKKPNLLKPLLFLLVLAIPLGFYYSSLQKEVERIVIVKASGEVTLKFNTFGDLIEAFGNNATGKVFIGKARFSEKDLDAVVGEIIEQAYITETIRERSTIEILISGKPLEKTYFHQGATKDRIESYQIEAKINDNGSFLYTK